MIVRIFTENNVAWLEVDNKRRHKLSHQQKHEVVLSAGLVLYHF